MWTEKEWALVRSIVSVVKRLDPEGELSHLRDAYNAVFDERVWAEFQPAMDLLNWDGVTLDHTGGGIYVLSYRWGEGGPDGPYVGIIPSETIEGTWMVCGFRTYEDDGAEFMDDGVPTAGLVDVVIAIATKVREAIAPIEYRIPGTVYWNGTRLLFSPAAGDAGYFGPNFIEVESGREIGHEEAMPMWDKIGEQIVLRDGMTEPIFEFEWEG